MDDAQERGAWKEMITRSADKMESGPLDSLDKGAYRWLVKGSGAEHPEKGLNRIELDSD